jgi:hypothetical protein
MPMRPAMTKSPQALARTAFRVAEKALEAYPSSTSRHDFTQPQVFAILVLKRFFQTDFRGIVQILKDFPELHKTLHLKKVPHFTTLQKAEARLLKKGLLTYSNGAPSSERDFWA